MFRDDGMGEVFRRRAGFPVRAEEITFINRHLDAEFMCRIEWSR